MADSIVFRILLTIVMIIVTIQMCNGISKSKIMKKVKMAFKWIPGIQKSSKIKEELDKKLSDPELGMSLEEIVEHWGYQIDTHEIITKDGYYLTLFRIPRGRKYKSIPTRPRPVVLFMHGLDSSCIYYVSNLPDRDGAYIYADAGYDVWLGNFRGNMYSTKHTNLTREQPEYWEFSMNEMVHIDLPAMIDYILDYTKSKFLYYIGHSMGTANAFALLSSEKEYNGKIRRMYATGPVTTAEHMVGAYKWMALAFGKIMLRKPPGEYSSSRSIANWAFAEKAPGEGSRFPIFLFLVQGPEKGLIDMERLPIFLQHLPAGTSWRTRKHFLQRMFKGRFQMYNYGEERNMEIYKQKKPPVYNMSNIETPVWVFYGGKDYLSTPRDVREGIIANLRNVNPIYLPLYNHVTFVWGRNTAGEIYLPIMKDIQQDFETVYPRRKTLQYFLDNVERDKH